MLEMFGEAKWKILIVQSAEKFWWKDLAMKFKTIFKRGDVLAVKGKWKEFFRI
jgi:hypothetical protein